jgi:hypothetical protein
MYDITDNQMGSYNPPPYTPPDITVPAEVPAPASWGQTGGTSVPAAVSTGAANIASGVSGILGGITATADTLLKAWGVINNARTSAAQQQLAVKAAQSDIEMRRAQVSSTTELQKIQSTAAVEIGKLQAQAAVAKAASEADAAKNGGVVYVAGQGGLSMTAILGIAALAFAGWKVFARGGKK